jgi:hypothetical protein
MTFRTQRRNLYPAKALTAGVATSQTEKAQAGRGVRLYVTISAVTAAGGTDSIALCALPLNGGAAIPLVTFSHANLLAVAGTLVFDFYPGQSAIGFAGSGSTLAAGASYGSASISLPLNWAAQITMGTGNAATIAIDAEILP